MSSEPSDSSPKPKRRIRYKGTHPRRFEEKYKELNPEKYKEDIEKIKLRGETPAGTHRPICLQEILQILNPQPGQIALDATLGYGGHSFEILQRVIPGGQLISLDQDPIERVKTEKRLRDKMSSLDIPPSAFVVGPINFAESWSFLRQQGIHKVDMVLADLGLSSMQIDTPERGFSFKVDAPLDLRMNPDKGIPAFEWLAQTSVDELEEILRENSDEKFADKIALELTKSCPQTTFQAAGCVQRVLQKLSVQVQKREGDAPVRRTFQALRIAVNQELTVLDQFLEDIPQFLKRGGRVAILSFHSGEDRRVKKSFQNGLRNGVYSEVSEEIIRPSFEEQRANPRSKSAKLRWAQI